MSSPQLYDMCQRKSCLHERGKHKMDKRFFGPGIKWGKCNMCDCQSFVGRG